MTEVNRRESARSKKMNPKSLWTVLAAMAITGGISMLSSAQTLFPPDLPTRDWVQFDAEGYDQPVCGVIYDKHAQVTNGMALGGVDTGCIDLESSGLLGYCTLFNTHVPRRGQINLPILGLQAGNKTWVLCDEDGVKTPDGMTRELAGPFLKELKFDGVETAKDIRYWGHYPIADMQFETDAPVSVELRSWSPFLPGDVLDSMIPGIVFEVHLRNLTRKTQKGAVAFSFPGPMQREAGSRDFSRKRIDGPFNGVCVNAEYADSPMNYSIGAISEDTVRVGGELGADSVAWSRIGESLPSSSIEDAGASVAVDFKLRPEESRIVRFALTWWAPTWKGGKDITQGGYNWASNEHVFSHMYAKHYPGSESTAQLLALRHEELLRRIIAWQQVIYTDESLPVWLRDSLINVLYMITEDGMWAQKEQPIPDWVREEDGLFGMNECPRGCPQIECMPCSFYGSLPIAYFFPELQLSTIRGYKGYSSPDGVPVWTFGQRTEFARPAVHPYQAATNGVSMVGIIDRFLLCKDSEDLAYTKEFYPMVKQCMIWTAGLRKTPSYTIGEKLIAVPEPDGHVTGLEWFELQQPGWFGMTAHVGTLHLAQLCMTRRMAKLVGDEEFTKQCDEWIAAASEAMENRLWDERGYYINFFKPETGDRSELVFGYQLDGEWLIDHHGLESPLPQDHITQTLDTIRRCNIALTKYGATNYANPDGTPAEIPGTGVLDATSGYGTYSYFPPELLMLAMTYMYNGQQELGLELARKAWHNIVCDKGYTWDMPNTMRGDVDTGEKAYGADYYQDMILWSMVAAVNGTDIAAPCEPGGLVDRVLKAASRQ